MTKTISCAVRNEVLTSLYRYKHRHAPCLSILACFLDSEVIAQIHSDALLAYTANHRDTALRSAAWTRTSCFWCFVNSLSPVCGNVEIPDDAGYTLHLTRLVCDTCSWNPPKVLPFVQSRGWNHTVVAGNY